MSEPDSVAHLKAFSAVWGTSVHQKPLWGMAHDLQETSALLTRLLEPRQGTAGQLKQMLMFGHPSAQTCSYFFSVPEVYSFLSFLFFLYSALSFYRRTNAQHVSCSHFIQIFIVSSLTLYWFWLPRWRNSHPPFSSCSCQVTANRDESMQFSY